MDHQDIARQNQVEHEMLSHIMQGLKITLGWEVEGEDASRKLSTLRFVVQSFQRHLERLLALEEHEGYMDLVLSVHPRLGRATDTLKSEHQALRNEANRLVQRLELVSSTDLDELDHVCNDLLSLLRTLEVHNRKEIALLQEAFSQDGGGEG